MNATTASTAEPPPVTSSGGMLLQQDGAAGYGQRLAEIEDRRRALTALNEREFAGNPARLRANRTAIEADSARGRAAVKAEADGLYADLRRYLTTGGPGGGRAVAPPAAMLLSRFTDAQQASIARQVDRAIAGQPPATDPQTGYAIHQALTGDDATERQRWASTNLVQFMDRLSNEDYAALERLQTVVRSNDGGAEATRLQIINRMAHQALRTAGIDPTPRPDAAPNSDAAQAATFHRALQDELSAFEGNKGRKATAAEAYDIVNGLKDTGIKSGWLKVSDPAGRRTENPDIPPADDTFHEDGAPPAKADQPSQPEQGQRMEFRIDFDRMRRMREEDQQREAAERAAAGTGAPATEPYPGSPEYQAAEAQARAIVAEQAAEQSGGQGTAPTEPLPGSPEYQTAYAELKRLEAVRQVDWIDTERMITQWMKGARPETGGPLEIPNTLPPELARRLDPEQRQAIENIISDSANAITDPQVFARIFKGLTSHSVDERLHWAQMPLYRYRRSLSPDDFHELAVLQHMLSPRDGTSRTGALGHPIGTLEDHVELLMAIATKRQPKPAGIPKEWILKPSRKHEGTRYTDPKNANNIVRVSPGNARSPYPESRRPYIVRQKNGKFYDKDGRAVAKNSPDAHIHPGDFDFERTGK